LKREQILRAIGWTLVCAPAVYQLALLATAIAGRLTYPYDLEWMEGGLLHHAQRLQHGHGIYQAPSVDFIPYLYTPLYPAILAVLGKVFGLGYTLGRTLSVLSLLAIAPIAAASLAAPRHRHVSRGPAWAGVVLALGLFAAAYPYVEGWYDLVRADTLFLLLVTAGIAGAATWNNDAKIAVAAVLLVLAFFAKQTGIVYVAFGAVIVAIRSPRRAATYLIVATVLGIGICVAANLATGGWFWIYAQKIHRLHDFSKHRFWQSFGFILWHFRALTIVVGVTFVTVVVTWAKTGGRELPRQAKPFLLWASAFAVSTIVGALGWGTEFARFNAYIPAFLHGALAAGAAIPALAACAGILCGARRHNALVTHGTAGVAALALAITCWSARWDVKQFVPTDADRAAGDKLIARLRAIDGDVWVPHHPWYAELAGKKAYVHRMGVTDVTRRQTRIIAGLDEALRDHKFAAIVLETSDLNELGRIVPYYRAALKLPPDERPRVFTGAGASYDPWGCCQTPDTIWLPALPPAPPQGAKVIFDFEGATWGNWTRSGPAWGDGPVEQSLPGQGLVVGATGHRFATSMHGGDVALGRMTSPLFAIDGDKITMMLGGGTDATKLRVELWVDGQVARSTGVPAPGGDTLRLASWDVADLRGKQATLVVVDDSPTGHLDIDDVWIWSHL
jgi:hypothetical protein